MGKSALLISHGRTLAVTHSMAEKMVHNRDFLTDAPVKAKWDRICGNPPYLRWLNVRSCCVTDTQRTSRGTPPQTFCTASLVVAHVHCAPAAKWAS